MSESAVYRSTCGKKNKTTKAQTEGNFTMKAVYNTHEDTLAMLQGGEAGRGIKCRACWLASGARVEVACQPPNLILRPKKK